AATIETAIAHRELHRARGLDRTFMADPDGEGPALAQQIERRETIAQSAPALLGKRREPARQGRRKADARDVEEEMTVDFTEIDRALMAIDDDPGGGREIAGNAEGSREIVRRSQGENAER